MKHLAITLALIAISAPAAAGPKWDASLAACGKAYDEIYIANSANPALDMSAYGVQNMQLKCLEVGASFESRTDFEPFVTGTLFTADTFRGYAGYLAVLACATVTTKALGGKGKVPGLKESVLDACDKRLKDAGADPSQ